MGDKPVKDRQLVLALEQAHRLPPGVAAAPAPANLAVGTVMRGHQSVSILICVPIRAQPPVPQRLQLDISLQVEPVQGELVDERGNTQHFTGWLDLVELIEEYRTGRRATTAHRVELSDRTRATP